MRVCVRSIQQVAARFVRHSSFSSLSCVFYVENIYQVYPEGLLCIESGSAHHIHGCIELNSPSTISGGSRLSPRAQRRSPTSTTADLSTTNFSYPPNYRAQRRPPTSPTTNLSTTNFSYPPNYRGGTPNAASPFSAVCTAET